MSFESAGHRANFLPDAVFEVAARAENFNALKIGIGNLRENLRGQLFGNEQISRE
jgi:hypothetical protein